MGFLDNVLNGLGDDAAGGLGDLLKGQGGVGGLVEKFNQAGLGDVVGSWVGKGANAAISAEQIQAVIGHGPIADIAAKMGISPQQASETLAGLLPEAIDRLTPGGQAAGADDLLNKLPGGLGGLGGMIGGFLKR
ncbi:YidB family protein [Brevundimonas nasdae]|uniref:YidB family protein n=1 Tax=Brevundimonas nasdae TaxID=172043 RepID=UPI0028990B09|nr:YidB family protein [Brevundimonas nasdae]